VAVLFFVIMRNLSLLILTLSGFILCSCSDAFEFSPYDTDVHTRNTNNNLIAAIPDHLKSDDTLAFAFIADSHSNYDDLSDVLNKINQHKDVLFIIHGGDITDAGLAQEFDWYYDQINRSAIPVITAIGNHDYRSNGHEVFEKIFGPSNMSFISGGYKFVFFDDVIWENNNLSPKYEWLTEQLVDPGYHHIVVTHIPPWADQMQGLNNLVFTRIANNQNTLLCLHGHEHSYTDTIYNHIRTIVSDSVDKKWFTIIKLYKDQVFIERYC
jgi:3',5'-cyclic-AMP phosphodiesterase